MFNKETIIDGKGHIMGRLASYVAKQLLSGHKVIIVRSESIVLTVSYQRNKLKFREYLNKTLLSNPRKGHKHFRSPSRIFFKAVRGMLPRKTDRGEHAMSRLKVFEGIPHCKKTCLTPLNLRVHVIACLYVITRKLCSAIIQ